MGAGLVGRYLPGVHELLHVGVVARHAHERPVVQQVHAGVAHVGHGHAVAVDKDGGGGAAHAGLAAAVLCPLDHCQVGRLDGGAQEGVVGVVWRGGRDGLHGDGARHLASRVAAHAVAYGKEGRAEEEGVLVVAANQPHVAPGSPRDVVVGAGGHVRAGAAVHRHLGPAWDVGGLGRGGGYGILGAHRRLTRMMVSPTCTSSPSRSVTGWSMRWPFTRVPLVELRSSSTSAGPCRVKRACVDDT